MSLLSALFLCLAVPAMPASAAPAAARAPAAQVDRTEAPAPATDREVQRYAEREQQSNQLERFEGGRTVVVITSLGALLIGALLVVLLV